MSKVELTEKVRQFDTTRSEEIEEIRRIRQLHNNKSKSALMKFESFKGFYNWYRNQYKHQNGECHYCHTPEKVVRVLFDQGIITSARQYNRGQHLEIDRKDPLNNEYSLDNCVLACYFCNNDKSDIFNEKQYLLYLKDRRRFLEKLVINRK